jgi:hypothetical protein
LKIKTVGINYHKSGLEVTTAKGSYFLPFLKLRLTPSSRNKIASISVDKELGSQWVTYTLESGEEDSVPLDAFLEYNRDPEYFRTLVLHQLTVKAQKAVEASGLSKREIIRKLKTSPTQLYRLLDSANYSKTVDQMLKLLACVGIDVLSFFSDSVRKKSKAA